MSHKRALAAGIVTALGLALSAVPAVAAPNDCSSSNQFPGIGCAAFADNFDGSSLDENTWNIKNGYSVIGDTGTFTDSNVSVSDGELKLRAYKNNKTSSEVDTSKKFVRETGYWEVSMTSNAMGWGGFWLYGAPAPGVDPSFQRGEIDAAEYFGKTVEGEGRKKGSDLNFTTENRVQTVMHFSQTAGGGHNNAVWVPLEPGKTYTYGVLKNSDGITVYRDGEAIASLESSHPKYAQSFPEGTGMHVLLSMKEGNEYWGSMDAEEATLDVDYMRYWDIKTLDDVATEPAERNDNTPTSDTNSTDDTDNAVVEEAPHNQSGPAENSDDEKQTDSATSQSSDTRGPEADSTTAAQDTSAEAADQHALPRTGGSVLPYLMLATGAIILGVGALYLRKRLGR